MRSSPSGVEGSRAELRAATERLVEFAGILVAHPKGSPRRPVIAKVTRGDQPAEAVG
jgi:hypothetical protein